MMVELRIGGGSKGAQTVFPGSTHEDGEAIFWEEGGEPSSVDGAALHKKVLMVAACAMMARYRTVISRVFQRLRDCQFDFVIFEHAH
jgi:hypothetical protein